MLIPPKIGRAILRAAANRKSWQAKMFGTSGDYQLFVLTRRIARSKPRSAANLTETARRPLKGVVLAARRRFLRVHSAAPPRLIPQLLTA
jgi:hypothetical protein